jgi:hypothetical protein
VGYRPKFFLTLSASSMPPFGFQCVNHRMNIPYEHSNYMNFTLDDKILPMSTDHALVTLCFL